MFGFLSAASTAAKVLGNISAQSKMRSLNRQNQKILDDEAAQAGVTKDLQMRGRSGDADVVELERQNEENMRNAVKQSENPVSGNMTSEGANAFRQQMLANNVSNNRALAQQFANEKKQAWKDYATSMSAIRKAKMQLNESAKADVAGAAKQFNQALDGISQIKAGSKDSTKPLAASGSAEQLNGKMQAGIAAAGTLKMPAQKMGGALDELAGGTGGALKNLQSGKDVNGRNMFDSIFG